ncbi:hypothetical protein N7478_012228 [Penicillium angulare]|uniref:uncharacterized protein n=1 Tax=Penicillium angulare TaxID=116970 RepID=UPI00254136E6|nr:uncharacterized protein N7478_012228 [Penicillium angulare]KAJ5259247.1 hypothetical protein N7478_012228 [Penicillium angulare]
MKAEFQVTTTPTADTPGTAIFLAYPDKRYFFGQISPGLQRACIERGAKLVGLTDVFITGRTEWANTGGLIGVILTMADALASANAALEEENRKKAIRKSLAEALPKGKQPPVALEQHLYKGQLTLHGTDNLTHTLATARRFVFRKGMPIFTKEYNTESIAARCRDSETEDPFEKPSWSDHNIKVWAMPIRAPTSPTTLNPPTQPRPQSPRKRSLDEYRETTSAGTILTQPASDLLVRQAIVTDMFNSTWKMDALVETPIADVNMPAAMFVRNPETKDMEPYNGPKPGESQPLPDIKVFVRQPWPGAKVETLPPTSPSREALCYIVRSHDTRGKFEPKKAKELRVKMGPDFARLTKGESVLSEDGKTITADMVLGPTRLGSGTAIMDVPSVEYVESVVNRPEWKSPAVTTGLKTFIWILGPGVGDHPKLRQFVADMSHCEHTVSSTDYCPNYLALSGAAQAAIRLARLKRDTYSIPVHNNVTLPQNRAIIPNTPSNPAATKDAPFEPLEPGLVIDVEPIYKINKGLVVPHLNTAQTVFNIPKSVEQRMSTIRERVAKPLFKGQLEEFRKDLPGGDAEVIALGTGSSAPSKYRNVSATLVYAPGSGYYLLDCGENTLGQLERVFEPEQLREVLRNLRMIWISHLHADHHLGTISVIKAWYHENYGADAKPTNPPETDLNKILQEKRLVLVSDEMMVTWLEEYASVEDFGADKLISLSAHPEISQSSIVTKFTHRHIKNGAPPFGLHAPDRTILDFNDDSSPLTALLKSATGLTDLLTAQVKHCRGALAVSFVFPDGFKVSYSGDCRPSDKFAAIGQDSTILIHEATFQDDMIGSALAKRHSTSGEALEVGRRMGARTVLLTHFSQRYAKIARFENNAGGGVPGISPKKAAATIKPEDADIPFDDPEDEPGVSASAAKLLDDIRFPSRDRPALPHRPLPTPNMGAPVAAAMDYFRVKIRDFPLAQAFAPASEKLIAVLERHSEQVSAVNKKKVQDDEKAQKVKKSAKFTGKKAAAAAAAAAAVAVTDNAQTEEEKPEEIIDPEAVFLASESEAGWETSDAEDSHEV